MFALLRGERVSKSRTNRAGNCTAEIKGIQNNVGPWRQLRMAIGVRVSDLTGTGMIFYSRVTPVLNLNRDGYGTSIFFHTQVT
jgi:hypothetical protein